jgi:sialate O-acetylesterase
VDGHWADLAHDNRCFKLLYDVKYVAMKLFSCGLTLLFLGLTTTLSSQIELPVLFTDQMVLQREVPVPIWGQTTPSVKITAVLDLLDPSFGWVSIETVSGVSDSKGHWQLTLSPRSAGGPYRIKISTHRDTVNLEEVLFGEVWLCSGQSNMEWLLKNSKYGQEVLDNIKSSNLRLFHLKKIHNMYNAPFTKEQFAAVDQFKFFEKGHWVSSNPNYAAEFSAVAYYFAELLQDSLPEIPIGIIQNAVSGSPAQSWLDATPSEIQHWLENDTYHPWLAERARENWGTEPNESFRHHPFEPGYLYQSAVLPLAPYPVRGVLWYQGESNATHPESYFGIMERVIGDWRKVWGYDLPFYSVQLPRISNRSRWPEFRAQQQALLKIHNTGLISLIDEGHPTDVHPYHKRVVGQRLAWLVLRQLYQNQTAPISPEFSTYNWNQEDRTLTLRFNTHGIDLEALDANPIKGFELIGYSGDGRHTLIIKPEITLLDSTAVLHYPNDFWPVRIQYAWKPFPEGTITNTKGMPLMPFKVNLPGNN